MRYPFSWKIRRVYIDGAQAHEGWDWGWVETPILPAISKVEAMTAEHKTKMAAEKEQSDAADQEHPKTFQKKP